MKSERKAALLVIAENIEMELFSSEEPCVVTQTLQEEEDYSSNQRHLEHPLVPDCEEEEEKEEEEGEEEEEEEEGEPELQVQNQPRQQAKPKTEPPAKEEVKLRPPAPRLMEDTEIEMEEFPPLRASQIKPVKSDDASIVTPSSPDKVSRLKWKRPTPQKKGLVVKDVVCLLGGHFLTELERLDVPPRKGRAPPTAAGTTARITIDCSWSANQMQSRLAMLFWGRFVKQAGRRFSFTYLQCMQSSRVLFVPDTPTEGWTGEQVIRICGHGSLYILCQDQDDSQAESERSASETPAANRQDSCPGGSAESCRDEDSQLGRHTQPHVGDTKQESTLDLDAILRRYRQENVDRDVERRVHVRRGDVLRGALQEVRRPGFCFRTTPIVSFSGEETDVHEGRLREFFRLTLLELQESSVFEGLPGRLFLTCDVTALEDRKYYEAGVLIGWSLAHGGPGPQCLHPALYQLMCGQNPSLDDFSWRDIVDTETQIRLQQLHSCTDVKLLSPSLCDWVSSCGIPGIYSASSDEISAVYVSLVKHYIYHRVASMISQFTEGLNSCGGLWDTVRSHWDEFVPVMTSTRQQQQPPLTLEEFRRLFTVCYSCSDSQLRTAEEATAGHWETVLTSVSDGQVEFSFEDLLTFITGSDHLPPLGFPRLISVRFYSQDAGSSGVRLPYASTCALELFLPRGVAAAADLSMLLSTAVREALGFTHACK